MIIIYCPQCEVRREERREEVIRHADKVLAGKKAKLARELEGREATGQDVTQEEWERVNTMDLRVEDMPIPPLPEKNCFVQLHTGNNIT